MRTLVAVMLMLAIPTFATAQQADDPVDINPVVEMERSTTAASSAPAAVDADASATDVEVQTREAPVEDAATMQDPATRQWWWLVGAIVVGGIILAVLL
jgi:hypothetical protein